MGITLKKIITSKLPIGMQKQIHTFIIIYRQQNFTFKLKVQQFQDNKLQNWNFLVRLLKLIYIIHILCA